MLLKYSGISFISGAVNHGFFSGARSLWTAAVGIILFMAASVWERIQEGPEHSEGLAASLALGTALSIGLGFFTGGLQHFPDSPARSAWVVPLGFAISAFSLWALERASFARGRSAALYAISATILCSAASFSLAHWLDAHPQTHEETGHDHGSSPSGKPDAPSRGSIQAIAPTITIQMDLSDDMRFTPRDIRAKPGESILFQATNSGKIVHEFVVGTPQEIAEHAKLMNDIASGAEGARAHQHGQGAVLSLAPGQSGSIAIAFPTSGAFEMACLVPGHYEAGMRGTITVSPAGTPASQAAAPQPKSSPPQQNNHDGHQHRH